MPRSTIFPGAVVRHFPWWYPSCPPWGEGIPPAHSQYEGFYFTDLTDHMRPIIDHWKQLHLKFSAVYSGFFGSHSQIEIVREMIDTFVEDRQFVVVDTVLGDNGKRYTPIDEKMVDAMKSLVARADVITKPHRSFPSSRKAFS